MSTSYPYLAIARKQNEDYGLVLHFADMVKDYLANKGFPDYWIYNGSVKVSNVWQQRARDQLGDETKRLIICLIEDERFKRP